MRTASLVCTVTAASLLGLATARAEAPVTIEKSLLGVRILQTYHDVLARWGQPTLVMRAGERFIYTPMTDAAGNDQGGIDGVSYEGGGSGGGAGGPGGMGKPGGGGGGGPMMGSAMGGPGMRGGGPGSGGPMSGGMGGGMAGGGNTDVDTTFGASGAYAWVYYSSKTHVFTIFAFNLEGRVMFVMERGKGGGLPTQRGVKLGDTVGMLYDTYGWPDTIQDQEPGFILDYGTKYHAKFAVIKNKVVGIGVVLEESMRLPFFPVNQSGGGPGGGPGGGGGGGGSPKMGAPRMGGPSM